MSPPTKEKPVAIITGASRGIGQATAEELARAGYRLALAARGLAPSPCTQGEGRGEGSAGEQLLLPIDITHEGSAETIVRRTLDRFGRVDALINNAGLAPMLSVQQTTPEIWRKTIDTNLTAAFFLARACWPILVKQRAGVIVNVSSMAARDPFPGFFAYAAAKAGLNTLGLALAREGAKSGIRVHTVAPGATETEMFRSLPGMSQFPKDQAMDPADVARVIAQCVRGDLSVTSGEVIYLQRAG